MNKQIQNLLTGLEKARKYYQGTQFENIVCEAENYFMNEQYDHCQKVLIKLPNEKYLLNSLIQTLQDKPVGKTLNKIIEDKIENNDERLKGLFSLGTHTVIEMKTKKYYKLLLPVIYEEIGKVLHERDHNNV